MKKLFRCMVCGAIIEGDELGEMCEIEGNISYTFKRPPGIKVCTNATILGWVS